MSSAAARPVTPSTGDLAIAGRLVLVFVVLAAGSVAYLTLRPQGDWVIWLTAVLAVLMTDGILRVHPEWHAAGRIGSVPYMILPGLAVLGSCLLLDQGIEGFARVPAGLVVGAVGTLCILGEYQTVAFGSRWYGSMRTMLAVLTYLTGFSLFAVISDADLSLMVEAALVGAVALGLAIELLRESHLVDASTPLVALAIAVTLAELRLGLYFFALDDVLLAALLVIGFYLATGMVHHLLDRDLSVTVAAEYAFVTAAGVTAVVLGRAV